MQGLAHKFIDIGDSNIMILYQSLDIRTIAKVAKFEMLWNSGENYVFSEEINIPRTNAVGRDLAGCYEPEPHSNNNKPLIFVLFNANMIDVIDKTNNYATTKSLIINEWTKPTSTHPDAKYFLLNIPQSDFIIGAVWGESKACYKNYVDGTGERCINTGMESIVAVIQERYIKNLVFFDNL